MAERVGLVPTSGYPIGRTSRVDLWINTPDNPVSLGQPLYFTDQRQQFGGLTRIRIVANEANKPPLPALPQAITLAQLQRTMITIKDTRGVIVLDRVPLVRFVNGMSFPFQRPPMTFEPFVPDFQNSFITTFGVFADARRLSLNCEFRPL
jgi:hypothetical protein